MTYGTPATDRDKYEAACFAYLRMVFNGAPNSFIRAAAMEVFKWSLYPRLIREDDETVH